MATPPGADAIEQALEREIGDGCAIGEILIRGVASGGFALCHRDDGGAGKLRDFDDPIEAIAIAKFDDHGRYRPLKTAPTLRQGWRLKLRDVSELRRALDYFYPGRLCVFSAWKRNRLQTTPLRETLDRQSGMYRVAAKISDEQINDLVGDFCRSDGGCLRTILWKRDGAGAVPSSKLPSLKFDPAHHQTGRGEHAIPLVCQEACPLLVNAAREVVRAE